MLPRLRQSTWLSGAVLLALAVALAAPVGYALGLRRWPFYVALVVGAILVMGYVERLWVRRPVLPKERLRSKFKVFPGGKEPDLSKDDSTDNPRWLM